MKFKEYILFLAVLLTVTSCRQGGELFSSERGRVVAVVGETYLYSGDVARSLPMNVVGVDSAAFVDLYVDRWVKHQIKVQEAERIFSSSFAEIEVLVEDYRNSLLSQKLNQYYLNTTTTTPFSDEDVKRYYTQNRSHFKLSNPMVKGVILRMPATHDSRTAITTMMKSKSSDTRTNLISLCEKSQVMLFEEFTDQWIEYSEFISRLPVVKGDSELYMNRKGVQSLKDDEHIYLFEITGLLKVGATKPLEQVDEQIRMLLTRELHHETIKNREEQLYRNAMNSDFVKIY